MGKNIYRGISVVYPTVANGAAITEAIPFHEYAGGLVTIPAAWTDANLGFQVCDTEAGTYVKMKDKAGDPVQIESITTNATFAYEIPPEVFGAHYLKLWSKSSTSATTTDTNQGAARSLVLTMKG